MKMESILFVAVILCVYVLPGTKAEVPLDRKEAIIKEAALSFLEDTKQRVS